MLLGFIACVLVLPTQAPQQPNQPPKESPQRVPLDPVSRRELQKFQGTWTIESMEQNGNKMPPQGLKELYLYVGGDGYLFRQGTKIQQLGQLRVDPGKELKEMTLRAIQGEGAGISFAAIYKLKDNTLSICISADANNRPTEFNAPAGSKRTLIICSRTMPKEGTIDITGEYRSVTTEMTGQKLEADTTIERRGDSYILTWRVPMGVAFIAVGIRTGDTLSVAWTNGGQLGVGVYTIEKGPKLTGQHTLLNGLGLFSTEVLTAKDD